MKKLLFAFVPILMTLLIVVFIMMQQVVKSTHVNPIPTLAVLPTETATLTPSPIPAKSIDVVFAPPSIQSTATSR